MDIKDCHATLCPTHCDDCVPPAPIEEIRTRAIDALTAMSDGRYSEAEGALSAIIRSIEYSRSEQYIADPYRQLAKASDELTLVIAEAIGIPSIVKWLGKVAYRCAKIIR
jgi:DNA integrity scanning protein DisA with diadenylate cyclase activity